MSNAASQGLHAAPLHSCKYRWLQAPATKPCLLPRVRPPFFYYRHAALRTSSICRNQVAIWFQLALFWSINSKSLIPNN
jgi:hypothetical protein